MLGVQGGEGSKKLKVKRTNKNRQTEATSDIKDTTTSRNTTAAQEAKYVSTQVR